MPNTDPIDIKFLINSDEVKAMAKEVRMQLQGVSDTAKESTDQMTAQYDAFFKSVQQQLTDAFGSDKIGALNTQLQGLTDEGQKFGTILQFIKDNVADLKLSPADSDKLLGNVEALGEGLTTVTEQLQEAGTGGSKAFETMDEQVQLPKDHIAALEAEMDKLIQREQMLQRAMNTTQDASTLEGYRQGLQETETRLTEIGAELDNLNANKFSASLDETKGKTENLLSELRNLEYEIAEGNKQYGIGSAEMAPLVEKAAQLRQELTNARKAVSLMASNTAGLDAIKQGFQGILGGMTGIVSAFALLSGNNSQMQETMMKLFAIMQLVNGAEQLFAVVNKNSATSIYLQNIATKLSTGTTIENTVATKANTVAKAENTGVTDTNAASQVTLAGATTGAAAATGGFKTILTSLMTPLGIVALAIADLVGIYELFRLRAEHASQAQSLLNTQLSITAKLSDMKVADMKAQSDVAVAQLEAQGKAQSAIRDAQLSTLSNINDEYFKQFNSATQNLQTLQDKLQKKYGGQIVNGQLTGNKSLNSSDAKNYQDANTQYLDAQKKYQQSSTDLRVKQLDDQKQLTQEGLQDYSASLAKRIADLKISGNQEQAIELEKQKNIADARAQAFGKSAEQQSQLYAAANEKNYQLDIRLGNLRIDHQEDIVKQQLAIAQKGSFDEFTAQSKMIDLEAQKEILSAQGNQTKIDTIKAEAKRKQQDLEDQANLTEFQKDKQNAVNLIQAKLDASKKGSEDELQLQIQLINQKEIYDAAAAKIQINRSEETESALTAIHAKALADRKKAEDDYYNNIYQLQIQHLRQQSQAASVPFQTIQNNPLASPIEKDNAAINETLTQQQYLQKEFATTITAYTNAVTRGSNEADKYKQKLDGISLALSILNGQLGNQQNQKSLDVTTLVGQKIQLIVQGLQTISTAAQNLSPDLGDAVNTLSSLAGQANNLYIIFSKTATDMEKYSASVNGVVQIIGNVIDAAAQRKQAEEQFNNALISQQNEYNQALYQNILLNSQLKDSVFLTDSIGKIQDGIKALSFASDEYQKTLAKLKDVQVVTGQRNAINWNNVLGDAGAGAAAGAAIGSVVPVIGTAIGAVVGGIVGGVAGLFSTKKKDTLTSILKEYPELIDQSKKGVDQFNNALAKTLIDQNLVKGASKETLQNLIDWKQAVEDAEKQIQQVVSDLAGSLGDDLRTSLVQAFEDGTEAGKAFADSVSKTLENVLSNLIFQKVFGNAFDQLQKEMEDSMGPGGDMKWQDDLQNFFAQYAGLSQQFDDQLKSAQEQAKAAGLDIFQSTQNAQQQGLAGAISRSITEDTANELSGLMRGEYDVIKRQYDLVNQSLNAQLKIEANTANALIKWDSALTYLSAIKDNTKPGQTSRDLGVH